MFEFKILQTFYANNRGKLRVKCKFEDVESVVKLFHNLFKDGKMDFDYNSKDLTSKEKEIKEIINALEYYEDNPNSAPPPKLLT